MQCFCPVSQLLPSWSCLPPHCTVVLHVFGRAGWTGAALETETRSQIFWKCAALGVLLLISETQLLYGKKTHASARARTHTLLPSFNMHTHYKLWIQRVFFFFVLHRNGVLLRHEQTQDTPCLRLSTLQGSCTPQSALSHSTGGLLWMGSRPVIFFQGPRLLL